MQAGRREFSPVRLCRILVGAIPPTSKTNEHNLE